ncbi:MAG: hypothetical protein K8R91_05705, partial [Phycisphaerae bacterium]|nr:hypothetical protein [Phycisphaerae bacterium]
MPKEPANKPPEKSPITPVRFGRNMMWWVVFGLIAVLSMSYFMQGLDQRDQLSQSEFWGYAKRDQVKTLIIKTRDERLEGELMPNIKGRAKDAKPRFYVIVDF